MLVEEWGTNAILQDSLALSPGGPCQSFITQRVGNGQFWETIWEVSNIPGQGNWIFIRASREHLFRRTQDGQDETLFSDRDQCLLFPQDVKNICSYSWLAAAWPFIAHFRSNFTLYPQLAFFYRKVTIIGHPDIQPRVDPELEKELAELGKGRQVERILCRSPWGLRNILEARIKNDTPFLGEDQEDPYSGCLSILGQVFWAVLAFLTSLRVRRAKSQVTRRIDGAER